MNSLRNHLRRTNRRVSASVILTLGLVLVLTLAACATSADEAEQEAVERVKKEYEVGRAAFAKLAGKYGVVRDEEATIYLNKLLKSLGLFVERQEIEYSVAILATKEVNAYALPGGFIFVTAGLVKQIEEPGELAGILAHELGHLNMMHILENVEIQVEYSFLETLARLLSGSRQVITNAIGQINDKIEERLFIEGYANDDEYEADAYAVNLLQSLNISAEPYYDYLRRLMEEADEDEMAALDRTHPPLTERLARITPILREDGPEPLEETTEFRKFLDRAQAIEIAEASTSEQ